MQLLAAHSFVSEELTRQSGQGRGSERWQRRESGDSSLETGFESGDWRAKEDRAREARR